MQSRLFKINQAGIMLHPTKKVWSKIDFTCSRQESVLFQQPLSLLSSLHNIFCAILKIMQWMPKSNPNTLLRHVAVSHVHDWGKRPPWRKMISSHHISLQQQNRTPNHCLLMREFGPAMWLGNVGGFGCWNNWHTYWDDLLAAGYIAKVRSLSSD